eukprot:2554951-Pleurochrysis_carterae.AAC.3
MAASSLSLAVASESTPCGSSDLVALGFQALGRGSHDTSGGTLQSNLSTGPWAPCSSCWGVPRWVAALVAFMPEGCLGLFVSVDSVELLDDKNTALRIVKLHVASDLSRFKVTQDLLCGCQRESEVARSAFHDQFHVQNGIDALAEATLDGTQLFGNQRVTELSVWRQRSVESSEGMMQCVEFGERDLR